MPASPTTVSFDHARQWARRLHKAAPALGPLSTAQAATAAMLGHASWHALVAFYRTASPVQATPAHAPAPGACIQCGSTQAVEDHDGQPLCAGCFCATEPLDQEPGHPDANVSFDETMANLVAAANARYPGLDATMVEVIANQTEELEGRAEDLIEQAQELEAKGRMFFRDAMEEVLERNQMTIHAPPGHVLLRVACKDGTRCMVVVDNQAYRATAKPGRSPKR